MLLGRICLKALSLQKNLFDFTWITRPEKSAILNYFSFSKRYKKLLKFQRDMYVAKRYVCSGKSRSDDTLLTVDFNLRITNTARSNQVAQRRHLLHTRTKTVIAARFCRDVYRVVLRWLKPPVNKVSSLRDFSLISVYV